MKQLILILLIALTTLPATFYGQCCAVGGGSPIAGDATTGVLKERQFELSSNFQFVNTEKFLTENRPEANYLDHFSSKYLYTKLAYGLSDRLTISLESGYWLDKTQTGLIERDTYSSKGIADLIIFPRYNVIRPGSGKFVKQLSVGLGFKIPLGSYNDSIGLVEPFSGSIIYITKPLAVQATSGSYDMLLNAFFSGKIPNTRLSLSASVLHILKGWNPLSEKLGNYTGIGLQIGYPLWKVLNFSIQAKGEWIGKMKINPDIQMVRFLSYDPEATGSRKFFITPQLSYLFADSFTIFIQSDIPVYQHVNKTQIASQTEITGGIAFRFSLAREVEMPVD
jgi:hypothetical protein